MALEDSRTDDLALVDVYPPRTEKTLPSSGQSSCSHQRGHSNCTIRRWNVNGQWQSNIPGNDESPTTFKFVNADGSPEPGAATSQKLSRKIVRSHVMRNYLSKKKLRKSNTSSAPESSGEDVTDSSHSPGAVLLYSGGWNSGGFSHIPYMLVMGDDAPDAPILRISGSAWPFSAPSEGPGPLLSICMPHYAIPAPNSNAFDRETEHRISHVPWILERAEYYQYKGEVVAWINHKLTDNPNSISDGTIGAIMSLIMWEMERNLPSSRKVDHDRFELSNQERMMNANMSELKAHMNGLKKIIKLRGGLHNIQMTNYFAMKLLCLDLIVAVLTNNIPLIPLVSPHRPTPPLPFLADLAVRPIIDSPLYGSESLFISLDSSLLSTDSIMLLQNLRDMTELAVTRVETSLISELLTDSPNPSSEARQSETTNEYSSAIHSVVLLASTIYQRALQPHPVPFPSPLNHSTVAQLHLAIIRQSQNNVWGCFPGVLTWVLLTGLAASIHMPERTFFVMSLAKTALGAMQGWWEVFTASVLRFQDVQRHAES